MIIKNRKTNKRNHFADDELKELADYEHRNIDKSDSEEEQKEISINQV